MREPICFEVEHFRGEIRKGSYTCDILKRLITL